jgi:hypothetical protein
VALPVGIFLAGWLRPAWAAMLCATLLYGVLAWGRRLAVHASNGEEGQGAGPLSPGALGSAALIAVAVTAILGSGGFGAQTWDWAKHNAILRDLIEQPWPVAYATGRDDAALIYYVAYYLPAALVGKVAGWRAANLALFGWTVIGVLLALGWLVTLSGAPVRRCVGLFVLFSGLDLLGAATWSNRWSGTAWIRDFAAEWWAGHWTYPANVTLLSHAPHQALGAWLLTGLTLDGRERTPGRSPHMLATALGLLWSPFAAVGLIAFAALDRATTWRGRELSRWVRDPVELVGGLVGLVLAVYFLSRHWPLALPAQFYPPPERMTMGALTFAPFWLPWRTFAEEYLMFVALEFVILSGLLAAAYRGRRGDLQLLGVAAVSLLVLPLVRYGVFNDLVMRTSIPALFVLQVLAARAPAVSSQRTLLRTAITAILLLGAVYPANMLRIAATMVIDRRALVWIPPRSSVTDLFQQQLALQGQYFFVGQYIGALDAPFFRLFARAPVTRPKGAGTGQ